MIFSHIQSVGVPDEAPAPAGSAGAQEPAPIQERGQRRSLRARQWQINLVVIDECCVVVCRTGTAMQFPAEFHLPCCD